jgi:hypothetical protein
MIEEKLIKIIQSLDRIMNVWCTLTLRRTLLIVFTLLLFVQIIITTYLWVIGREISNTWLGVITVQHSSWAIMISWYFSARNRDKENGNRYIGDD